MAAWTSLQFSFEEVLSSTKMNQLQDNFTALAEGASGAPRIAKGGLKTTTGTVSTSRAGSGISELEHSLPGGQYGFYPEMEASTNNSTNYAAFFGFAGRLDIAGDGSSDADTASTIQGKNTTSNFSAAMRAYLSVRKNTTGTSTLTARQRYMQSSPPYDFGDGEVNGFVYLLLRSGLVVATYIAEDPPWYGNTKEGSPVYFQKGNALMGRWRTREYSFSQVLSGEIALEQYINQQVMTIEEEITPQSKLRGMDEMPHPFVGAQPSDTVVMLDPVSDISELVMRQMKLGDNVGDLFHHEYLTLDNTSLTKRKGPPGVPIHAAKWRNTGA